MDIATIGTMEDKVFKCPFCGNLVDIADSFSTTEVEESETQRGNSFTKTKKTVIRQRSDGPLESSQWKDFSSSMNPSEGGVFSVPLDFTAGDSPEEMRRALEANKSIPPEMVDKILAQLGNMDQDEKSTSFSSTQNVIINEVSSSTMDFDVKGNHSGAMTPQILEQIKKMHPDIPPSALHDLEAKLYKEHSYEASEKRSRRNIILLFVGLLIGVPLILKLLVF